MNTTLRSLIAVLSFTGLLVGCGGQVSSDEQARRAYLGLDGSIGKALQLGFTGYNTATNANIAPQTASGDVGGTLTVSGQVDAGASDNKTMHLEMEMADYSDGAVTIGDNATVTVTYDTLADITLPALDLNFQNYPAGTFSGTISGPFQMTGDLEGEVLLDLAMSGDTEDDGAGGVRRVVGTTTVTGTATAGEGHYTVELTL
jgi:hypothetical protein